MIYSIHLATSNEVVKTYYAIKKLNPSIQMMMRIYDRGNDASPFKESVEDSYIQILIPDSYTNLLNLVRSATPQSTEVTLEEFNLISLFPTLEQVIAYLKGMGVKPYGY